MELRLKLLVLVCLFFSSNSLATNRYLDTRLSGPCSPQGSYNPANGSCSGGSGYGYNTLSSAHSAMVAGDTLYLVTDWPIQNSSTVWNKSGASGNPITITSYSSRHKFYKLGSFTGNDRLIDFEGASYITIDNVEFDASTYFNKCIYVTGSTAFIVKNSYLHDGKGECFKFTAANSNMEVSYSTINNCGLAGSNGEGIYIGDNSGSAQTTGWVHHNTITNVLEGMDIKPTARAVTVEYNDISNVTVKGVSSISGISLGQQDSSITAAANIIIRNNKIYNVIGDGTESDDPCMWLRREADVYNNMMRHCGSDGIHVNPSSTAQVRTVLNIHHNAIDDVGVRNSGAGAHGNWGIEIELLNASQYNIKDNALDHPESTVLLDSTHKNYDTAVTNPLWVNPGAGDFHLQSASPLAAAGVALTSSDFNYVSGYTVDYDNVTTDNSIGPYSAASSGGGPTEVITLLTPNGPGAYKTGSNVTVTWSLASWTTGHNVDVLFSPNGGASYSTVASNVTGTALTYSYTLAAPSTSNAKWRVRCHTDTTVIDSSKNNSRLRGRYF